MKKILALCSAVVLFALMGTTTAAAQVSGPSTDYTPSVPVHDGLSADGSVVLNFSDTGCFLGQDIVVEVGGVPIVLAVGADGQAIYPPDFPSLAGQSVTFTCVSPAGVATTVSKSFSAPVAPTPAPTTQAALIPAASLKPVPLGDPATAMVTTSITTPNNLPDEGAATVPAVRSGSGGPSVPLALTGGNTSVPVMIGSGLILAGGLAIAASRRRAEEI